MIVKGQKINDRYEIIRILGEGGMANVYLANDTILNRKVAVKVLRGDLANDEKFVRRFQREALSASSLNHPNIVEIYDVGEDDGNFYIVMEYVDGKNLKQLIKRRTKLSLPEVIDIMKQLTDGIAHAHDSFIIHRDIKPQNMLILDNGLVKITDFGIAVALNSTQLTQTNSVMGSVHYLPPEQAAGKGATIKSDIYSLGILMFELLTGTLPFKGENAVEIALKQMKDANKKKEEKIAELQEFIRRFSANASKSKQATSRKKLLEKIELDEIKPSNRKYPYINFEMDREPGKEILFVENLTKSLNGKKLLNNISINVQNGDKIAFVGPMGLAKTELFEILTDNSIQESGEFKFGITTSVAYFPKDNTSEFNKDMTIVEWLMQYSKIKEETFVRGFLGRMLFSGEEALKKVNVLSGGEKVRCMLAKMMLSGANILIFDEPTNHLDLESITALNNGLINYKGVILFTSHDHQFVQTIANRIIEITPNGLIDRRMTYDEYLETDAGAKKREIEID